jgi:hypothetical protein
MREANVPAHAVEHPVVVGGEHLIGASHEIVVWVRGAAIR